MSEQPSSMRRSRVLGIFLLGAVFACGALSGAALGRLVGAPALVGRDRDRCSERRGDMTRLFEDLRLSGEQRARAEVVLERRRAQMEAFWKESGPRLRAIVDSTHAELGTLLTPAQREQLDRLRAKHQRKHGKFGGPLDKRTPHDSAELHDLPPRESG